MKLEIINVYPNPKHDNEHVKIKVIEKCNLGNYAITDETFNKEGKETDVFRHTYFFPDMIAEKDNIIYLYSGKPNQNKHKADKNTIVIYWGSKIPIWNNSKDKATIISYEIEDEKSYGGLLKIEELNKKLDDIMNDINIK